MIFRYANILFYENDDLCLELIEYDKESNNYFLFCFYRDEQTGVANKYFVAKLINDQLCDIKYIDNKTFQFIFFAKYVEFTCFTKEAYRWLFLFKTPSLNELKIMNFSLSSLWEK